MKSKLLIVADLGLVKAYQLDFIPNHTPQREQLEGVMLEEAYGPVIDKASEAAGRNSSPTLTKVGQKELLDQFLNTGPFVI